MATHLSEPSSSLSFASSSYLSNGSSVHVANGDIRTALAEPRSSLEIVSLSKLSSNLESLLLDPDFDCSDAEIVVEGEPVPVHRCILSARSKFFLELFTTKDKGHASGASGSGGGADSGKRAPEGKPKFYMNELVPQGCVRVEAFKVFLGYLYTGKLKPSPPEVSTCVDAVCAHDACRPAINFAVELMYASSVFQIPELISLFQRRLLNFVEKAFVEDVIPILLVAFHANLDLLLKHCVQRVARSDLDDIALEKELPAEAVTDIKSLRRLSQPQVPEILAVDNVKEKRIRRIHRALDSDDVELVTMLLEESGITLDDAYALHYAVAYCDSKVAKEVLAMGLANVNLKNQRGYTPLHLAAMRREPAIIISLLDKGASASEITADGQTAVSIGRRLTRAKDYYSRTERGQESNKDRLCIDVLERELMRNPMAGEETIASPMVTDDVHMKLIYLENRVAFARLFFPTEAKVAMELAQVEKTREFAGLCASEGSSSNLKDVAGLCASKGSSSNLKDVDLNETPSAQNKRLRSRMEALTRTVELGRRYFPNCSQVLDKFLEDDHPDFFLERGTPDEQKLKRIRFMELKEDVHKAFTKDKAECGRSALSSSSSSSSSQKGERKQSRVTRK